MKLLNKPDCEEAARRIEAWFAGEMLDRPPVRFAEHNAEYAAAQNLAGRSWPDLRARWFDAEYQVELFLASIRGRTFHGETFPVFWPNLGPNMYAAFHGCEVEFGEITSWIRHCVNGPSEAERLEFRRDNVFYQKIEELTRVALERCDGSYLVGYTDLHGSLDCVADWRGPERLCMDTVEAPDFVHRMLGIAGANFLPLFDQYDAVLKAHGQPSVTWMGIPVEGKLHISSCDFGSLISPAAFEEFYLPWLTAEVGHMTHNIFHLDGKGMLRHLDRTLAIPEIHAIQWVHGVGDDAPIMQWIPVIETWDSTSKKRLAIHYGVLESDASRIVEDLSAHRACGLRPSQRKQGQPQRGCTGSQHVATFHFGVSHPQGFTAMPRASPMLRHCAEQGTATAPPLRPAKAASAV